MKWKDSKMPLIIRNRNPRIDETYLGSAPYTPTYDTAVDPAVRAVRAPAGSHVTRGNSSTPRTRIAGANRNPMLAQNPYPNTNASGLGLDKDIETVTQSILDSIQKNNEFNLQQRDLAISGLLGPGGLQSKVGGYYDTALNTTKEALPLNPFSDAIKQSLMTQANDQITRESQDAIRQASEQLASRGLSSGGSTGQTAAGGIASDATRTRVDTKIGLDRGQMEFNTEANTQRQAIINDLINKRAGLESQIGSLAAGIKSGNVIDPNAAADELGGAFGLQLSRENQDKMMKWIEDSKATLGEKFLDFLPAIFTAMNPSAGALNALSALPGYLT